MADRPQEFRLNYGSTLAQGLVFAGLGRFPYATHYRDSSLFGNHGALTNMEPSTDWVWEPQIGRWSLAFDGNNERVWLPANSLLLTMPLSDMSVSFWAYAASYMSGGGAFGWGGTDDAGFLPYDNSLGNGLRIFWRDIGGNIINVNSGAPDAGKWNHFAFCSKEGLQTAYVNGALVGTATSSLSAAGPFNSLAIGGAPDNTDGTLFPGKVSDVLLHTRVLASSEIVALADPSNALLSGLIVPPMRRWFPTVVTGGSTPDAWEDNLSASASGTASASDTFDGVNTLAASAAGSLSADDAFDGTNTLAASAAATDELTDLFSGTDLLGVSLSGGASLSDAFDGTNALAVSAGGASALSDAFDGADLLSAGAVGSVVTSDSYHSASATGVLRRRLLT